MSRFTVEIELADGTATFVAHESEFILDAARRAGLELPSVCEQGWCTRCAVSVLEGTIDQSQASRYYEDDRLHGFGLPCTGRACSALRLRADQHEAMRAHRQRHGHPVPHG